MMLLIFLLAENLDQHADQYANRDAGENPADDTHFRSPAITLI